MPKRSPRHLEPPRRPWRLTLFAFGLTASVLAAVVAAAALAPHDPTPATPGQPGALSTFPPAPAATAASATTVAPTTTLPTTTSADPTTTTTTTDPATTTAEPTTTTVGPAVLGGARAASVSTATAAMLVPIIGLLYLLRGLLQPGGRHARPRSAKHLRRRG